jgi:iron complex outermembrane receptor protein
MLRCWLLLAPLVLAAPAMAQVALTDSVIVVGADTLFVTEPIEVVGGRVPAALPGALRPVGVVDLDEAASTPLRSAADALAREPAVVTGQRQAYGVQGDLSLRGSTFEQVQMLLDGVDLGDPQTGHHLMDLPLALQDVARLQVLPGHGSVLYGSGAFGGTVNVIPRRPARGLAGELGAMGGPDGTWSLRGSLDLPLDGGASGLVDPAAPIGDRGRGLRLSAERFRTDGHEVDGQWSGRDADLATGTLRFLDAGPDRLTDLFVGYADRRFGAQDFYAPAMSHEETSTLVAILRSRHQLGEVALEPRLALRRHRDLFTLHRDDPQAYQNDHLTRRYLGGVRGSAPLTGAWILSGDLEGLYEDIDSEGIRDGAPVEALGEHRRRRTSAALELTRTLAPVRLQAGGRIDLRDRYRPRWNGSVAAAWEPRPTWSLHAAAGTVFRIPTYTELYYEDPYNLGNPALEPETGWAWDTGLRHDDGTWLAAATYFERHEDDLIDWARPAGSDAPWQVLNVAEATVRGAELRAAWRHGRGHRLELGYQYLDKQAAFAPGTEAKYDLVTPRHHLLGSATALLPLHLDLTLFGRWLQRTGGEPDFREYAVWDARLRWTASAWAVTLDAFNLGDRRYAEVPGVVMPGRTLLLGASWRH